MDHLFWAHCDAHDSCSTPRGQNRNSFKPHPYLFRDPHKPLKVHKNDSNFASHTGLPLQTGTHRATIFVSAASRLIQSSASSTCPESTATKRCSQRSRHKMAHYQRHQSRASQTGLCDLEARCESRDSVHIQAAGQSLCCLDTICCLVRPKAGHQDQTRGRDGTSLRA